MVMILALLLSGVSRGADENDSEAQARVYSDWLRLGDLLEASFETAPLTAEGPDYVITVTPTADARIPKGARLTASELGEKDARHHALLQEAALIFGCAPEALTHSRLFDLAIETPDGSAVQPAVPVQVRIRYAEPLLFEAAQRFLVVHLGEDGGDPLEPVAEGPAEGGVDTFTFTAGAFSLYGIVSSPLEGDRSAGESTNLADFLDSVVITGADLNEDGKYVIHQGVPYTIQLNFSEKAGSLQFNDDPDSGGLVYEFPEGFTPHPGTGTVEMTGAAGVMRFNYEITEDRLVVTFDETSPGYAAFLASETAQFEIHATGIIDKEEIAFSSEITGEFDIDDTRKLSVEKTGSYDEESNRVKFTVKAYSKGNNSDIHIGDIVSGTALAYDPASLTVTSNLSNPVQYSDDTRAGETFGLTIPSMAHGETITIEYCADVDLTGLSSTGGGHYGTFDETSNSIRINSHEDPPGDDDETSDEDFEHRISLSSNSKTASGQTVHGEKTYVTWTIVLNENARISLAGQRVTDTIDASSQAFMRYSGAGIHVEKYLSDGTLAGSSDVPWGTGGLTASHGGSTWTYTIPESDAGMNYRYVITYETEVDSDEFLKETTVSNSVHDDYDTDYSSTVVEPTGEEVEAEKTALDSTVNAADKSAETEWEITFTVPAAGLDSAVVIDSLPAFLDYTRMHWFYDTYKDGSAYVEAGDLAEGEGFTVDAASQEHKVIITFTKDNGQPGLTGTGLARTIHVHLTTEADHDWLLFAESESRARTHTNNAIVRLNGQDLDVVASVSYNTTEYDMEKKLKGKYATSTEPPLPVYVYWIVLENVNDNAFNANGWLTITDTFDAEYLAYHPTYSVDTDDDQDAEWNVNHPNGYIYGNTQWNKDTLMDMYRGPYVVDPSSSEGELIFKVHRDSLPKSGTAYFPYYTIAYALQIKDAETLNRMQEEALHNDGLKVSLGNTAYNEKFGSHTIVTEYKVEALEKELLSEEDNESTGTHDLHFQVMVNENGLMIGDEDTITLKDTLSSLSFDYTSIVVDPQLEGDILNRTGNSIIFTLHNAMPYTITYTARLIGIHDVHWANKAELFGYTSGVSGVSSSETGGSGTYGNYSMNVKKYEEGNMNKGLPATFELYEARTKDASGQDIAEPDWIKVGEFTTDAATGLYQIGNITRPGTTEAQSLRPYSFHDAEGHEQFGASYGWRYRIREIIEPPGYQKTTVVYEFGISDIPSYVAPYNYLNDDTVTIINQPIGLPVSVEVAGTKVLLGKTLKDMEFIFTLRPEESAKAAWGENYPGTDEGLIAMNDINGRFSFKLNFTYRHYLDALDKGFVDENQRALFYYVVSEKKPDEAVDNIWNGVRYDDSQFLVVVRLYIEGGQLQTEVTCYPYDGTRILTRA